MFDKVLGAKLALFLGDQLPVMLRDDRPGLIWPGYWDLPGGGREAGETPLDCALRETQEEFSLTINAQDVIWGRPYGTSSRQISWFFVARLGPELIDQIALGDEGQRWDLMTPAAFMDHNRVVPQFKHRLQDYLSGVPSDCFDW